MRDDIKTDHKGRFSDVRVKIPSDSDPLHNPHEIRAVGRSSGKSDHDDFDVAGEPKSVVERLKELDEELDEELGERGGELGPDSKRFDEFERQQDADRKAFEDSVRESDAEFERWKREAERELDRPVP